MSAVTTSGSANIAGRFFLRWSDTPDLLIREEPVEVIESSSSELTIRSTFWVRAEIEVFLIGDQCVKSGIVHSCRREGDCFLLIVYTNSEYIMPKLLPSYDPGVFAVDNFLTEEEEAKILGDLDGGQSQRCRSGKQLNLFLKLANSINRMFGWWINSQQPHNRIALHHA